MADSLNKLARDLFVTAGTTTAAVRAVVAKGALNVKTEGKKNSIASSGQTAAQAPHTISYDIAARKTFVEGVIGYEARGQGNLGHLLEYGSSIGAKNPPHRDLGRALDAEEQPFIDNIGKAALIAFTLTRGGR